MSRPFQAATKPDKLSDRAVLVKVSCVKGGTHSTAWHRHIDLSTWRGERGTQNSFRVLTTSGQRPVGRLKRGPLELSAARRYTTCTFCAALPAPPAPAFPAALRVLACHSTCRCSPVRPVARRSVAQGDCRWCWTDAAAWGRVESLRGKTQGACCTLRSVSARRTSPIRSRPSRASPGTGSGRT